MLPCKHVGAYSTVAQKLEAAHVFHLYCQEQRFLLNIYIYIKSFETIKKIETINLTKSIFGVNPFFF